MRRSTKPKSIVFSSFLIIGILCAFCNNGHELSSAATSSSRLAFPTATGYGKYTVGGRNGKLIWVSNLNDEGPGSLRNALRLKGPRTILFEVSGIIDVGTPLNISNPYVTLVGQSAPGQGITIRNSGKGSVIRVLTSEVILRGLRIRKGRWNEKEDGDCISIKPTNGKISNIVIDHCSLSWATDEIIGINDGGSAVFNVSITNNIISEGLSGGPDRNKAVLLNKASDPANGKHIFNVTFYQNLFAHNRNRNVMCSESNEMEFINNYIYNFNRGTVIKPGAKVSIIGNYYKAGANTKSNNSAIKSGLNGIKNRGILVIRPQIESDASYYLYDNVGLGRTSQSTPGENEWDEVWTPASIYDNKHITSTPPRTLSGINPIPATEVSSILQDVGAIAPKRDEIDQRIIDNVLQGTGFSISNQIEVGGYLDHSEDVGPLDTDKDGMPDRWENDHGYDPEVYEENQDSDNDGYSNLEEYLNSLL